MPARAALSIGLAAMAALAGCAAPAQRDSRASSSWTAVSPTIRVQREDFAVEFDAVAVIETGFLEEYVCTAGTREHESLFAYDGKASEIHAAMLLAGLVPGAPGRWRELAGDGSEVTLERVPPTGDELEIRVRLADGTEHTLDWFVRRAPIDDQDGGAAERAVPPHAFRFAGSRFRTDRRTGVEHYLADGSGSLVGLVTFGDELIAPIEVIPDQASASSPVWEVWTERMPRPGTKVAITVRRTRASSQNELKK